MLSMYGGQGMGTAGVGAGGAPSGANLQQIMAMLQAQGGAGGGAPGAQPMGATPLAPGNMPTPMSNYLGHAGPQQGAGGMMPPQAPPMAPQQGAAPGGAAGGAGGSPMQLMQMLAAMKGGQNGVAPSGAAPAGGSPIPGAPGTGGADSMIPAWLQAMLHSGSYGATGMGMAPAVGPGGMQGGGV